jgi:hypothetical protein
LGVHPDIRRYAAPIGTVLIRWDGARRPAVWTVPAPAIDPGDARLELARRYLHIYGPTTPESFARWAGLGPGRAPPRSRRWAGRSRRCGPRSATPGSSAATSPPSGPGPAAPAQLLPSGDAYWLLRGADRELLVPDPDRRGELWTPRVWPGALLVDGEIAGTWRRADAAMTIQPWRPLSPAERDAVAAEAAALPLPALQGRIVVRWDT